MKSVLGYEHQGRSCLTFRALRYSRHNTKTPSLLLLGNVHFGQMVAQQGVGRSKERGRKHGDSVRIQVLTTLDVEVNGFQRDIQRLTIVQDCVHTTSLHYLVLLNHSTKVRFHIPFMSLASRSS